MKIFKGKKKNKKLVSHIFIYVNINFNNALISITDPKVDVLAWSSCGSNGFKGSKKSTPFAAQVAAIDACKKAKYIGAKTADIFISGPGSSRETALRAISNSGIKIMSIKDVTPIPHNGCRPSKRRRV